MQATSNHASVIHALAGHAHKFRLPCESGDRALSQGDRTDERTVRQSRRDFGRATMANQTSTATIDTTDINLRHEYDDAGCLPQPPGATSMDRMGTNCTMTAMQRRARSTAGQLAGPPSVHWQRDRRQQRTKHQAQPPGATLTGDSPAAAAASAKLATKRRASANAAVVTQANARKQRPAGERPELFRRSAAAAVHPPGATRTAAKIAAESTAAAGSARKRGSAGEGAESSSARATHPHLNGWGSGDDAAPIQTGGSPPLGATLCSLGFSPPPYYTRLSPQLTYQTAFFPLVLLAAVAATVSFWERRHFGTSRPHRVSCCLWQLEDETSVHSNKMNKRLYLAESAKCVARALERWGPTEVRTNCNLHSWYNTPPPYDMTRLPVTYLWHSYATIIIEHRLPWLGHGLANTASRND